MRREGLIQNKKVDWLTVFLYLVLVLAGWLNIYAAVYDEETAKSIFEAGSSASQFYWIIGAIVPITLIMVMDYRFYDSFAYVNYLLILLLLIFVMLFAREVAGARSWFEIGPVKFQPSEPAKFVTALALAKFLSGPQIKLSRWEDIPNILSALAIIGIPFLLIVFQGDAGTATVFAALVLVLYREGMTPIPIVLGVVMVAIFIMTLVFTQLQMFIGIGGLAAAILLIVFIKKKNIWKRVITVTASALILISVTVSVNYLFNEVLKPHQQNRLKALVNPDADPKGYGYNVNQSKIAIGSGGFTGKGFLQGTQTKGGFVPEQRTDFIFCTIGEEHGWLGSFLLVSVYMALLLRVIFLAERQKSRFARVYGYSVACILFYHFVVNVGMTIGLYPVMGIPLPFFSYGGSSLWSFTILLFILIKLDAHRSEILVRT